MVQKCENKNRPRDIIEILKSVILSSKRGQSKSAIFKRNLNRWIFTIYDPSY